MGIEEIKQIIKNHISELMDIDVDKIFDTDLLIEDLGADSIVIVQLYVSCQEDFGVTISEELDLSVEHSVEQIAEVILEKMNKKEEA